MSHCDYMASQDIAAMNAPFYAIIMAAYRQADTHNAEDIRSVWPGVVAELQARYDAPGGLLPGEWSGA